MKPVYMCEYCDKIGDARTISIHESACNYNPENQACHTCKHAIVRDCGGGCIEVDCGYYAYRGENGCWEKGEPKRVWTIY